MGKISKKIEFHACTVNEDNTDNGTSCARCTGRSAEKKQTRRTAGVEHCHNLNLMSDHLLLHSWDFHDVLCRLGSRMKTDLHCILDFLRNVDHRL